MTDSEDDVFGCNATLDVGPVAGADDLADIFGFDAGRDVAAASPLVASASSWADDLGLVEGVVGDRLPSPLGRAEQHMLIDDLGLDYATDGSFRPMAQRRRVIPQGVEHRSWLFQSLAARCRRPQRDHVAEQKFQKLAAAWDSVVLRHGDKVDSGAKEAKRIWTHGNTYTVRGLLKTAFSGVGTHSLNVEGEVGIHTTRRNLEELVSVAGIASAAFARAMDTFRGRLRRAACIVVNRFHDSTPMLLKYGRLEAQLAEHARYLKRVDPLPDALNQSPGWTTISWEQFRREKPSAGMCHGRARGICAVCCAGLGGQG